MTVFLPLEATSPFPQTPSFLAPSPSPDTQVKRVVKALLKARRVAVVCGAGISVQAGIPDFRSSEGLFQTLKKDNPTLSSGRDLFDASVFNSEATTSLFCQMIAQLAALSEDAAPTAFHRLLRMLDDRGRLLRVYTQNIDALESKSGLTFGVPEEGRRKPRSRGPGRADPAVTANADMNVTDAVPVPTVDSLAAGPSRLPTPPVETPRCIPLHGTLQLMHCQICTHSFPLRDYLHALTAGRPPCCPECTNLEATRQLVGKRSRGVGKLRPSVVLYNEMHKDGEGVGDVVRRDLIGSSKGKGRAGADLLLVVGTSLRVPGTKRIVREFAKAVRSRAVASSAGESSGSGSSSSGASTSAETGLATPTPSPRRSPAEDEEPPVKTVYLNFDFPVPTREWEGVFDVWIQGDAQRFAQLVFAEIAEEGRAKEAVIERKRRREEIAEEREREREKREGEDAARKPKSGRKRKGEEGAGATTPKRRKTAPPSPVSIPRKGRATKPASSARSKPISATKAKGKVPVDDVLPSSKHVRKRAPDSSGLKIRIPPPSKRPSIGNPRLVPEVLIMTPSRGRIAPPTPSPSTSPLTPIPSPSSRRTASPCKSPVRGPASHSYGAVGWGPIDDLSDLTDDGDESGDASAMRYTHASPHRGLHNGYAPG